MLTDKQQKALNTITEYITKYGKSPTIDELMLLMEQKSKRWVVQYLESLEKKWFITRWRWYRSIVLWNNVWFQTTLNIPILGYANAWTPLVEATSTDYWILPVSKNIISWEKENYFILRVEWTSMNNFKVNNKFIDNGSYVLIKRDEVVSNEKDAFLFIVNNAATLKTSKKEGENLYLLPTSNDTYHKPIILSAQDDIKVNWKVVDVFNFA